MIAFTVEIKVLDVVIISLPFLIFSAAREISKASVPLPTPTTYLQF